MGRTPSSVGRIHPPPSLFPYIIANRGEDATWGWNRGVRHAFGYRSLHAFEQKYTTWPLTVRVRLVAVET